MADDISTETMRPASLMATRTFDEGDPAAEPKRAGAGMGNPFTAEMSLLSSLTKERISNRKEGGGNLPPPVPLEPGQKRQNVPALNEHELAMGEVQTLPAYGKLLLGKSSTDHSGIKEMQITRKAKHEAAIQAYGKKVAAMEVTLETRTGHAGRGFKKLLTLNDEEIQAIFDEMADEFLLEMELVDVNEMWDRLHEQTTRREGWINDFEADLQGVEAERRAMTLPSAQRDWLMFLASSRRVGLELAPSTLTLFFELSIPARSTRCSFVFISLPMAPRISRTYSVKMACPLLERGFMLILATTRRALPRASRSITSSALDTISELSPSTVTPLAPPSRICRPRSPESKSLSLSLYTSR